MRRSSSQENKADYVVRIIGKCLAKADISSYHVVLATSTWKKSGSGTTPMID